MVKDLMPLEVVVETQAARGLQVLLPQAAHERCVPALE